MLISRFDLHSFFNLPRQSIALHQLLQNFANIICATRRPPMITFACVNNRSIFLQSAIKVNTVSVLFSALRNNHVNGHLFQLVPVDVIDELMNRLRTIKLLAFDT